MSFRNQTLQEMKMDMNTSMWPKMKERMLMQPWGRDLNIKINFLFVKSTPSAILRPASLMFFIRVALCRDIENMLKKLAAQLGTNWTNEVCRNTSIISSQCHFAIGNRSDKVCRRRGWKTNFLGLIVARSGFEQFSVLQDDLEKLVCKIIDKQRVDLQKDVLPFLSQPWVLPDVLKSKLLVFTSIMLIHKVVLLELWKSKALWTLATSNYWPSLTFYNFLFPFFCSNGLDDSWQSKMRKLIMAANLRLPFPIGEVKRSWTLDFLLLSTITQLSWGLAGRKILIYIWLNKERLPSALFCVFFKN